MARYSKMDYKEVAEVISSVRHYAITRDTTPEHIVDLFEEHMGTIFMYDNPRFDWTLFSKAAAVNVD